MLGILSSCSMEETANPQENYYEVIISATIADEFNQVQTRTCVDMSGTTSGALGILWQNTDCIGVYSKDGSTKNAKFQSLNSGSVRKADFGGSMTEGDDPWRAYYPFSEDNDGLSFNALKGVLPSVQPFNSTSGSLTGDYKYGAPVSGTKKFNFRHLFSLLRISVDATGTPLAGDKLESVVITVTDPEGKERPINGSFVFNAENGSWGNVTSTSGTVTMPWTDTPILAADQTYWGFVTVMPTVLAGDRISVTVNSSNYKVSFSADCNIDFVAENVYNIPLKLSGYAANPEKFGYVATTRPAMKTFGFNVSDNSGKLLDNKCIWNSSNKPQFDPVSSYSATISGDIISLMIPYLYDFKLVPTFTVSDGNVVTLDGETVESGKTLVDFTDPVTFTVTSGDESRDYTVNISNTGIPVVVLEQSGTGDFSKVTTGGFLGIGAKTVNQFVDFWIRGKETEWVSDDLITVYNADGSVDLATTTCGARLRGNTTQEYPKKPFALKLTSKAPILGMPAHKRWVLLANWLDHSMIRNSVAFDIAHAIEDAWKTGTIEQGIPWNVHGQNVELVFVESDGTSHHVGNYYLCEQIKIDGNRLDIQDSYEDVTNPTFATCGYLLEFDSKEDNDTKFTTSNGVPVKFKDDAIAGTDIYTTVCEKIQDIEDCLDAGDYATAYNMLDINSVVDQFLIWELTMNREYGDPGSVYMFMDGDSKLCAGPVWDFDRGTFQNQTNATNLGNTDRVKPDNEWMYWRTDENKEYSYIWYRQLAKDSTFQKAVQNRWAVIYPHLQNVVEKIRNYGKTLKASYEVDSEMWPTDADAIHAHKDPFTDWSGDEEIASWDEVVDNFVTVYQERLEGMNSLITSGKFTN